MKTRIFSERHKRTVAFFAMASFLSQFAWSSMQVVEFRTGQTTFEAQGRPNMLKIKGQGGGPAGQLVLGPGGYSGTLTVDLRTLKTGMSLRDRHMHEKYLETERFPDAKLEIADLRPPNGGALEGEGKFRGRLTLKGQARDVEGVFRLSSKGDFSILEGEFPIRLQDFPVGVPSFGGVTVADDVRVFIVGEIQKREAAH